jgi:hypothetical protein
MFETWGKYYRWIGEGSCEQYCLFLGGGEHSFRGAGGQLLDGIAKGTEFHANRKYS